MSCITRFSTPFRSRPMFSLVFLLLPTYLEKPCLLLLISLARFNFVCAFAFLTASFHGQAMSLYSSQVTCPFFHLLYISFLCLNSVRSTLFYAVLLAFLPDFVFVWIYPSWVWKRWWVWNSFLGPLLPPVPYPMGLFQMDLWRSQSLLSCNPVFGSWFLSSLFFGYWTLPSLGHCSQGNIWHYIHNKPFLVDEYEVQQRSTSPHWLLYSGLGICHWYSPGTSWIAVPSLQLMSGWLKSLLRIGSCESEAAPNCP